ncbi:MAG: NAD-dependent epimerase/dehydratase family protein [Cyanobacteriota bacterium]|jgi:UDP-glucose 4-epimerase
MKTVLVIGGCGFIGSHIVDQLQRQGLAVRVLSRRPETFREPVPGVDYVLGSMADDDLLDVALEGVDAVIHTASSMVPQTSNLKPVADITENLISSVQLFQKMKAAGVGKLVFLSSGGTVYGIPRQSPLAEDHPLRPISSYGVVKVAIENYIQMFSSLHGLEACILRPSNPYGPRQGRTGLQGVIGVYLSKIARNEPLEVWGDGTVIRDFIYVEDLAELCVLAIRSPINGVFNAGSGLGVSIGEIIDLLARMLGRDFDLIHKQARNFDVPANVLDISKVMRTLNWSPKTSLEVGIQSTWQWIQHIENVSQVP